jgi:hypothetical protein
MSTILSNALAAASVAALIYGLGRVLALRLRARRHRRLIRADLEQRRCQFALARRRRFRLLAARQTYDVEYVDPERDSLNAVCTVERRNVAWSESDGVPGPFNELIPTNLPDYGQNWRG